MTLRRTMAATDGCVLSIDDAGGDAPPVVFQHGLTGDAAQTAEIFPQGRSYRRVTLECRGHGLSELGRPENLSIATFAEDVALMIAGFGQTPLAVGGISTGAALSLRLAVRRPELVRALILVRPAWGTEAAPDNMRPMAEAGSLLRTLAPAAARAAFQVGATAAKLARHAPDNLKSLTAIFGREPADSTAHLLCAISADGPGVSEAEVRRLEVPCLILACDRDHIHPVSHAEKLAAMIPKARFLTVTPKSDNHARYVGECRDALGAFLEELSQ